MSDRTIVHAIHALLSSFKYKTPSDRYVICAAFVLTDNDTGSFKIISLATGSKCLPTSLFSTTGDALHDSHAEVLARRAAVRWFYEEIQRGNSQWLESTDESQRYRLRKAVNVMLYVSTPPCGDASMRYLAAMQDESIAALKDAQPPTPSGSLARGRDGYAYLGLLRTKPGRADSPRTSCLSCSDKIALWSVCGIQGALLAQIMQPVYIDKIVIGEASENEIAVDCERAFYHRVASVTDLPSDYHVRRPKIMFIDVPFSHSRSSLGVSSASHEALSHVADSPVAFEIVINGRKRGVAAKQFHIHKFQPSTSKVALLRLHIALAGQPHDKSYYEYKQQSSAYQLAKSALIGGGRPFADWPRGGPEHQTFTIEDLG